MKVALILAGGIGSRMKKPIPKQFIEIEDKPLIIHTLEKFVNCDEIDSIVITCLAGYIDYLKQLCTKYEFKKDIFIIGGGATRAESIKAGLNFLSTRCSEDDIVVIHNANMPMITEENIVECLRKIEQDYDVVTTVAKCTECFYELYKGDQLKVGPDRDKTVLAKVPEAVHLGTAQRLYSDPRFMCREYESYATGMVAIMAGMRVGYIYCSTINFKITTEDDYALMRLLLIKGNNDEKNSIC